MPVVRLKDAGDEPRHGSFGVTIGLPNGMPYHVTFNAEGKANVTGAAADVLKDHPKFEVLDDDPASFMDVEESDLLPGNQNPHEAASAGNLSGTGMTQTPALDPTPELAEDPEEAKRRQEAQLAARQGAQRPALDPTVEDAKAAREGEDTPTSAGPATTQQEAQQEQMLRDPNATTMTPAEEQSVQAGEASAQVQDQRARAAQRKGEGRR